jgi:hypothetical protein
LPNPYSGETETAFVSRCIPIVMQDNPETDQKQAAAICYSKFRNEAVHPDFQRIIGLFLKRYGKEGISKFAEFVQKNNLNISKMYNPKSQFRESFEWIEPLIMPYKQDHEAKYYLVRALTANISMNNNDYGPYDRMEDAAPTLAWRPVNIDHDHNQWLPYPRTRTDFSNANELSVEATLRVDNRDAWLQKMLDNKEILHPSIEGRPDPMGGYHFTGMALLRAGQELPGDPLTEILPLVFNESVGRSLCSLENGRVICECESKNEVREKMSETEEPKIMCPEGQYYSVELKKCVPKEASSDVKEKSDLRLKCATLELKNIEANDKLKAIEEQLAEKERASQALTEQYKRGKTEDSKKIEELTNTKYTQEGVISEKIKAVNTLEKQLDLKDKEKILDEKTIQTWQRRCEEATTSRDQYKEQVVNERHSREVVFAENQKLSAANLQLTNDLTESRNKEVAWTKEKVLFTEDLSKAMKHQKYLYNFLKEHNFAIVEATP